MSYLGLQSGSEDYVAHDQRILVILWSAMIGKQFGDNIMNA